MNLESRLEEGERRLAHVWRLIALCGVLSFAFGVALLVWPDIGLDALLALFGAFALVVGVVTLVESFRLPFAPGGQRAWLAFEGLLGIAVGVVVVVWPDLSARGLLYAIAAWAIAAGVVQLSAAFVLPLSGGRRVLFLLGGLVSAAFGVIMFARPGAGAVALLALIAAFAIVMGVLEIGFAFELRSAVGELKGKLRPRATTKPATHG
jgi:uncharacterized membrane protein HdeD (DUF308 family)